MPSRRFSATDLHRLERQLRSWRRSRRGHRQLPNEVWQAAAALAGAQGLSRVARCLRLDYYKLRRLSSEPARLTVATRALACPPGFVELACPSPVADPTACRVELRSGRGATMTLHLPKDTAAVIRLVELFWRQP